MGRHFSTKLVEHGAYVAAGDVNEAALMELADSCKGMEGKIFTHVLDVTDESSSQSFIDKAYDAMGGLTGLVNNAGILRDGLLVKKDRKTGEIVKMTRDQWQAVIDVNLTGASLMVRDVVAKMIETDSKPGVVINMSSLARHGNRGQSNYVAAKASLAANTVTWAREFGRYGIRVGAIAPGMIETPMTQGMNQKARDQLVTMVPVGRIGNPDDIWLAVKFIVECDYFTGRVLDVDGGLVM
jgi:3-oxoacyl-[acyl-carrier protein] reductase